MMKNTKKHRRQRNNSCFKAHRREILLSAMIMFILFCGGFVSAWDWDNVKDEVDTTFDGTEVQGNTLLEMYSPLKIINILGLGETLFEGYMSQHDFTCGQHCKSTIKIKLENDGILIDEIIFKTLQEDKNWIEQDVRNHRFRYWGVVEDYEYKCIEAKETTLNGTKIYDCANVLIGTHNGWVTYHLGTEVSAGIYELELNAEKKPSRTVDWIIKTNGEWLEEWATWGNISEGDDAEVNLTSPADNYATLVNTVTFNATAAVTGGATLTNMSLWTNETGSWEIRNSTSFLPTLGQIAYYKLDGVAGAVLDNEGNYDGINVGALRGETGKILNAFYFDGVDDYVNTTYDGNMNTSQYLSISLWFNTNETTSNEILVGSLKESGADDPRIVIRTNINTGSIGYQVLGDNGTSTAVDGSHPINDDTWHHVVLTMTPSEQKLYLDGVLNLSSAISTGNVTLATNHFFIGALNLRGVPAQNISSLIDEVRFWEEELSASDVSDLYAYGASTLENLSKTRSITEITLWNVQACDSDGDCGFAVANRTLLVDPTKPTVVVTSPPTLNNFGKIGNQETLNITATDANLDSCWYDYNGTNTTIAGCASGVLNSTTFTLEEDNLNMTIYANDTMGNLNTTFIEWNYRVLENNRTHNSTTFETASETFNLNLTANASLTAITLLYNDTEYSTTKSGTIYSTTLDVPASLGNKSIRWKFTYAGDTFYSGYTYQNVSETVFTFCNTTYTEEFLNISFKDESDSSFINASLPSSTWTYYLGSGTEKKTYNFVNASNNYYYSFCAIPKNRTLNVIPYVQYKQGTDYPQRVWNPTTQAYTNTSTSQTFYLLGAGNGIYVTFQVVNPTNQVISGVDVTANRTIESADVPVGQGTTGADGAVTFWLNPDFVHGFTFEKSGFDTYSTSFTPTQSSYTITLGAGTTTANTYFKGIAYTITPTNTSLINDTDYTFGFLLTSSFWDLDEYGFNLRLTNGTIISGGTTSTSGTQLSQVFNTNNQTRIYIDYWWKIEGNYTNATRDWIIYNTDYTQWSINYFFTDLTAYMDTEMFGLDDFGQYLIIFLVIFFTIGIMSYKYGFTSPMTIFSLIFLTIFFFDVVIGLIPTMRIAGGLAVPNLLTFITGLILVIVIFKEATK